MGSLNIFELSRKEQLVLAFLACSQTIKETARCLGLTEKAVEYYRGRIKCRLGAVSSNEVIRQIIFLDEYQSLVKIGKEYLTGARKPSAPVHFSVVESNYSAANEMNFHEKSPGCNPGF